MVETMKYISEEKWNRNLDYILREYYDFIIAVGKV